MIIFRRTGRAIENLNEFDNLSKADLKLFIDEEEVSNIDFIVPKHFIKNTERNIYKTGFVCSFLKKLYSEKKFDDIVEIMNKRYQIFLSRRQIERILSKFNSDKKFTN